MESRVVRDPSHVRIDLPQFLELLPGENALRRAPACLLECLRMHKSRLRLFERLVVRQRRLVFWRFHPSVRTHKLVSPAYDGPPDREDHRGFLLELVERLPSQIDGLAKDVTCDRPENPRQAGLRAELVGASFGVA